MKTEFIKTLRAPFSFEGSAVLLRPATRPKTSCFTKGSGTQRPHETHSELTLQTFQKHTSALQLTHHFPVSKPPTPLPPPPKKLQVRNCPPPPNPRCSALNSCNQVCPPAPTLLFCNEHGRRRRESEPPLPLASSIICSSG